MELGLDNLQVYVEKLARLPKPYRMALVPAAAALVILVYGYFFFLPARQNLSRLHAQERQLTRQVSEVRAVVENAAAFKKELQGLKVKLARALQRLPNGTELPGLLTDISTLGKDAGLEFNAFRPEKEVPKDFYAEVPIDIEFTGNYHDIAKFFDEVSKLPRIVNVRELHVKIHRETTDHTTLEVKGQASTFRFLGASEAGSSGGAGKAPVRRGRARGGRA